MKKSAKRRPAPKKLRAIQTSRHLHVSQHRHTGHVLSHRSTSYPMLAMILLCVGVFIGGWTRFVTADPPPGSGSYTVHLSVPGPPPSVPATIDNPTDGAVFTNLPITVSGSCPVDTYETLYRNGAFSGVALCSAVGDYQLQTGLFPGVNKLQVRDFSPTDAAGPLSSVVSVTYNPPLPIRSDGSSASSPPSNTSSGHLSSGEIVEPLIMKTTFVYQGYYTGQTVSWNLDIEGGDAPYAIAVDWGDGQHGLISQPKAGSFSLDHTYKKAGGYKGSYPTSFSASDASGNETFLQLLTIVNNPPKAVASTTLKSSSTPTTLLSSTPDSIRKVLQYIWPSYGFVVLLLLSFWLGERRELQYLRPGRRKPRHG